MRPYIEETHQGPVLLQPFCTRKKNREFSFPRNVYLLLETGVMPYTWKMTEADTFRISNIGEDIEDKLSSAR